MNKFISFISLIFIVCFVVIAESSPRDATNVVKTSRNDGDTITPIYVSCSSTTWTTIVDTNKIRRVAKIVTLSGSDVVCLSSAVVNTALTCDATRPSYRLIATEPYEHASEAILKCRAADTKGAVAVYGIDYKDSEDNIVAP